MEKISFKYDPRQMTKEELTHTYVGRNDFFSNLLTDLRGGILDGRHLILTGSPGIGKTHTLLMIYFASKADIAISMFWIPIWFTNEGIEIRDLRTFFLKILEELYKENRDPLLFEFITNIKLKDDYLYLYNFLKNYLNPPEKMLSILDNKGILLLIDNIDFVFSKLSDSEVEKLRDLLVEDLLLHKPHICIWGGMTNERDQLLHSLYYLFEIFEIRKIPELIEEEIKHLLYLRIEQDKKNKKEDEDLMKVPGYLFASLAIAFYRFISGNPKSLLTLYQLCSLIELKDSLFYLNYILDNYSQYFLDKMKTLTDWDKRIIDTLAKSNLPITLTKIAQRTGIREEIIILHIYHLIDKGYLTSIEFSHPQNITYYELSNRIFRIWYQMRIGGRYKRRIQSLITFLIDWCNEEMIEKQIDIIIRSNPSMIKTINYKAIHRYKQEIEGIPNQYEEWYNIGSIYYYRGDEYDLAIECYKKAVEIKPDYYKAWEGIGNAYYSKGEYTEATKSYQKYIETRLLDINQEDMKGFRGILVCIFRRLIKAKQDENADKLFQFCERHAPKSLLNILYPLKIAIKYLVNGNKSIIERQPIEFRKIIEDILKIRN